MHDIVHRKSLGLFTGKLQAALGPWGQRFLADLGLASPGPLDSASDAPTERPPHRVLREQFLGTALHLLRAAASVSPLFLLFEDIQNAGELATELIARVSRSIEELPILLVVTYRPTSVQEVPHVERWLSEMQENAGAESLVLGGFPDNELSDQLVAKGVKKFLVKPVEKQALLKAVAEILS